MSDDIQQHPHQSKSSEELAMQYSYWGEHPDFSVADWKYDIESGYTRQAYWDWVVAKIDDWDPEDRTAV